MDVLGPDENIVSAWTGGSGSTRTQSGTAMAAAHAAGIAATVLSLGTPANQGDAKVRSLATKNAVTGLSSGPPNALLFNGISL
ncbi:S8 family serine peptidase [Streptomyces mirabilis]